MKLSHFILLLIAIGCSPGSSDQATNADSLRIADSISAAEITTSQPAASTPNLFIPSGGTIKINLHDQLMLTVLVPSDVIMEKEVEQLDDGFQLSGSVQIPQDTNSDENGDFMYQISVADGVCKPPDENSDFAPGKKTINDLEFTVTHGEDNAMHVFYSTYSYQFEWKGACFNFTLNFSASTYSDDADNVHNIPRDQGPYIEAFERFLGTIQLK
ncbi:MAG: hypothetical protein WDO14_23070 [Bacteroidota bacterium]